MKATTAMIRLRRHALALLLMMTTPLMAVGPAPRVDAEVRGLNREMSTLTLRHGPIPNLEMDGMTMVFKVADPAWLGTVKVGDKVRITADRLGGELTVTTLERLSAPAVP
ncbi:hypothetical protein BH10PSE17_BH10PSE17_29430 [soil metagenome]